MDSIPVDLDCVDVTMFVDFHDQVFADVFSVRHGCHLMPSSAAIIAHPFVINSINDQWNLPDFYAGAESHFDNFISGL